MTPWDWHFLEFVGGSVIVALGVCILHARAKRRNSMTREQLIDRAVRAYRQSYPSGGIFDYVRNGDHLHMLDYYYPNTLAWIRLEFRRIAQP